MKRWSIFFFLLSGWFSCGFFINACESDKEIHYPFAQNTIDVQIDDLLREVEYSLFRGEFTFSLETIEKAESLLSLTEDKDDYRKLRILFDKALTIICIEGPSENSLNHFVEFENFLATKNCSNSEKKSEVRKNWSFQGPDEVMTVDECLRTVANTMKKVHIAAAALPVSKPTQFAIQATLLALASGAEKCANKEGFGKLVYSHLSMLGKTWKFYVFPQILHGIENA